VEARVAAPTEMLISSDAATYIQDCVEGRLDITAVAGAVPKIGSRIK